MEMQDFIKQMMLKNQVVLKGNYTGTLRPFTFNNDVLGNQAETLISLKEQYKNVRGNSRRKIIKQILDCIQAIEDYADPLQLEESV
tara:strand:+ start:274 stop:531 length:258 start_codon:yes stop_codon:yes gene_type:complete